MKQQEGWTLAGIQALWLGRKKMTPTVKWVGGWSSRASNNRRGVWLLAMVEEVRDLVMMARRGSGGEARGTLAWPCGLICKEALTGTADRPWLALQRTIETGKNGRLVFRHGKVESPLNATEKESNG